MEQTEGMDAGWYNKAVQYWDKQEASYDGVLGGFGFVSEADVHDSEQFLHKVLPGQPTSTVDHLLYTTGNGQLPQACVCYTTTHMRRWYVVCVHAVALHHAHTPLHPDCGAGVGRITQELLLRHFSTVDLVEPSAHLLQQAQANVTAAAGTAFPREHALGAVHQCGLQQFSPDASRCDGDRLGCTHLPVYSYAHCVQNLPSHPQI